MADNARALENVLGRIRAEHREIQALLRLFGEEPASPVRLHLVSRICGAIRLHCNLEAGVFIPAIADAMGSLQLLQQTGLAYFQVIGMINELASIQVISAEVDRLVNELHAHVDAHIAAAESEDGFLSRAPRLDIDWCLLESAILNRRTELSRMGSGS